MKKFFLTIRKYGVIGLVLKFIKKITYRLFRFFDRLDNKHDKYLIKKGKIEQSYRNLEKICSKKKYKQIYIFYPYSEWDLPVFQRPQQIALSLSKRNDVLYLFCTANYIDNIDGLYKKINDNLYVVTDYEFVNNLKLKNKILHLYSTDITSDYSVVEKALNNGEQVLYEYIDEIHEDITMSAPDFYLKKHQKILKNEKCSVVVTADKLKEDLLKYRKKNYALSTNGVNVEDFIPTIEEVDERIKDIQKKYDKIVCYYGSLAVWFDYKLLIKAAKKYPNYAFLLIGIEYDNSMKKSGVSKLDNIIYLGKIPYKELINITKDIDLFTIPFVINEITESTSPVKLFEYMATQKPILTTNMKECRKYKSVIIGKDHTDYINKIESTIKLNGNKEYMELELKEANENTWDSKANIIVELIENNMKVNKK